jgi:hypothetical protein
VSPPKYGGTSSSKIKYRRLPARKERSGINFKFRETQLLVVGEFISTGIGEGALLLFQGRDGDSYSHCTNRKPFLTSLW